MFYISHKYWPFGMKGNNRRSSFGAAKSKLLGFMLAVVLTIAVIAYQQPMATAARISFVKIKPGTIIEPASKGFILGTTTSSHHHKYQASTSQASPNLTPGFNITNGNIGGRNNNKVVMINFDDSFKSQSLYAKPILDKFGFKATFFEVCNYIGSNGKKTWQDILALKQDGMDIESHTMTHAHLNTLSAAALNYEIGGSKQCLLNHGINTPIFAYPYSEGWNNPLVVSTVAKYYNLARTDSGFSLTFLQCNGWKSHPQTDCRTYSNDGKLTFDNRYSIKSWTHRHIDGSYSSQGGGVCSGICHSFNNAQMLQKFIADVNSQLQYNKNGVISTIPIVIYHNLVTYPDVSYSTDAADTTVNLFDQEMKYLHDNGFRVLTMANLGYNINSNSLYIKGNA